MPETETLIYLRAREAQENEAATRALDPAAKHTHSSLAQAFSERIMEIEQATLSRSTRTSYHRSLAKRLDVNVV